MKVTRAKKLSPTESLYRATFEDKATALDVRVTRKVLQLYMQHLAVRLRTRYKVVFKKDPSEVSKFFDTQVYRLGAYCKRKCLKHSKLSVKPVDFWYYHKTLSLCRQYLALYAVGTLFMCMQDVLDKIGDAHKP